MESLYLIQRRLYPLEERFEISPFFLFLSFRSCLGKCFIVGCLTSVDVGEICLVYHFDLLFIFQDISRCLLWTQRHHQTWPQIRTDILTKPIDLLMLNRLKESYCEIKVNHLAPGPDTRVSFLWKQSYSVFSMCRCTGR